MLILLLILLALALVLGIARILVGLQDHAAQRRERTSVRTGKWKHLREDRDRHLR